MLIPRNGNRKTFSYRVENAVKVSGLARHYIKINERLVT